MNASYGDWLASSRAISAICVTHINKRHGSSICAPSPLDDGSCWHHHQGLHNPPQPLCPTKGLATNRCLSLPSHLVGASSSMPLQKPTILDSDCHRSPLLTASVKTQHRWLLDFTTPNVHLYLCNFYQYNQLHRATSRCFPVFWRAGPFHYLERVVVFTTTKSIFRGDW